MDKYIGKLLGGRYEIIDVVGVGGMAVVYRARCHVLNRYVAVKILKDEYARDPDIRKRFSIESQVSPSCRTTILCRFMMSAATTARIISSWS